MLNMSISERFIFIKPFLAFFTLKCDIIFFYCRVLTTCINNINYTEISKELTSY